MTTIVTLINERKINDKENTQSYNFFSCHINVGNGGTTWENCQTDAWQCNKLNNEQDHLIK